MKMPDTNHHKNSAQNVTPIQRWQKIAILLTAMVALRIVSQLRERAHDCFERRLEGNGITLHASESKSPGKSFLEIVVPIREHRPNSGPARSIAADYHEILTIL
jgi:hypothetical protein